jgi:predicted RNA-binding Zn-ribbon protein involved in translation (DUF1610 family)
LDIPTTRTSLACVLGINSNQLSFSSFNLVRQHLNKTTTRGIVNAFSEIMVFNYIFDSQFFNRNNFEFQKILEYEAEEFGKQVVYVNPRNTSKCCSVCGNIEKSNRQGSTFKCKKCGFELNPDINASRNITELGKAFFSRLSVKQLIVANLKGSVTSHLTC